MQSTKLFSMYCLVLAFFFSCKPKETGPDNSFDVSVSSPQLMAIKPRVCFDESHKEHHLVGKTYKPFAQLITNDGCVVEINKKPIDKSILANADIYAIITPMGWEDPGDIPPFSEEEIDAVANWVENGGSLLLVTEHYPFGLAMKSLLAKFGVNVHNGYTEDTLLNDKNAMDALLFEKSTRNLNTTHPICQNVSSVHTFTGTSIIGDSTCVPLLIFSDDAQNFNVKVNVKRNGNDVITSIEYADFYSAKKYVQGLCKNFGKGKIVVLAESAMLTAQTDRNGKKFGMNVPGNDNKEFALNVIRWLADK